MPAPDDSIIGALLGLAIGDALGAPVAGMKAGHIQQTAGEVTEYADSRTLWPGKPSHWRMAGLHTAAAQQALAVADVLGDYGSADTEALADLWVRLLRAQTGRPAGGHRAPGVNFLRTVRAMADGAPPLGAGVASAGNGAAARIAPAAMYWRDDETALLESVVLFSLMTHTDPRAIAAAAALACAVARLTESGAAFKPAAAADLTREIQDATRRAELHLQDNHFTQLEKESRQTFAHAMSDALDVLPPIVRERNHLLARQTIIKEANRRGPAQLITDAGVAFAPASVTAALYYALSAPTFFHGLTDAIADGRDTAAMGAMTGALLGARFGAGAIPEEWVVGLVNCNQVRLRGRFLAEREVDYMMREDYVEMETRLTLEEARHFEEALKQFHKEQAASEARPKAKAKPRPEAATPQDLGFAPPPETWMSLGELTPDEKRREKERRARRRIDWKETRREMQRQPGEPPPAPDDALNE